MIAAILSAAAFLQQPIEWRVEAQGQGRAVEGRKLELASDDPIAVRLWADITATDFHVRLDWELEGRAAAEATVQFKDPATGQVLHTDSLHRFSGW